MYKIKKINLTQPELFVQNNIDKELLSKDYFKIEKKEHYLDNYSYDDKTLYKITKFINGNFEDISNIYKKN